MRPETNPAVLALAARRPDTEAGVMDLLMAEWIAGDSSFSVEQLQAIERVRCRYVEGDMEADVFVMRMDEICSPGWPDGWY